MNAIDVLNARADAQLDLDARTRLLLDNYRDPEWRAGSAEPWVGMVIDSLLVANASRFSIKAAFPNTLSADRRR